jgi:ribosome modulation factor
MPLCERCKTITDLDSLRNLGGSCPSCGLDLSRHLGAAGATRPQHELQQAHDLLVALVVGQLPIEFDPASMLAISRARPPRRSTLYHDHNPTFGQNLKQLRAQLDELGIEAAPLPRAMTADEMAAEGYAPEVDPPPGAFPDDSHEGCKPDCGHTQEEHIAFNLGYEAGVNGEVESVCALTDAAEREAWLTGLSCGVLDREAKEVRCAACGSTVIAGEVRAEVGHCPVCQTKVCIYCGCTDQRACPGGCCWIAPGVCSSHPERQMAVSG